MTGPLEGVRVLDLSRVLSGPYASMGLADLGAEVVKVERPGRGDDTRGFGPPFVEGVSTYFMSINRGKKSITLNLKDPEDRETLESLLAKADVLLENFRPGVMGRLGLGYEDLKERFPRLVYCSISGFGQSKPGPGYDLMVQGMSGIPSLTGEGDSPWKCGASIADLVAGMNATQGILAALYRRERTGRGGQVDVSMLDSQLALLTYHASAWLNGGKEPRALGNAHPSIHPFRSYATADGWLTLAVGNDTLFEALCEVLETEWHRDPRFSTNAERVAHREDLDQLLEPQFLSESVEIWLQRLQQRGIPCGPMHTVPQALKQAHILEHPSPSGGPAVRTLAPGMRLDGCSPATSPPPELGAHREEILSSWSE